MIGSHWEFTVIIKLFVRRVQPNGGMGNHSSFNLLNDSWSRSFIFTLLTEDIGILELCTKDL